MIFPLIIEIFSTLIIVFFSIILHECAHGWVAYKLGDPTAKQAGRLTLNPIKHIDPIGTLLLPGILLALRLMGQNVFLFGWAKPVPVDFRRLRKPRRDMMLVGAAGPIMNIILAFLFSRLMLITSLHVFQDLMALAIFVNLLLAVFNLIPIPPLDGSRIVMGLLPRRLLILYSRLERYGILIVVALLYFGMFRMLIMPIILFSGRLLGVQF